MQSHFVQLRNIRPESRRLPGELKNSPAIQTCQEFFHLRSRLPSAALKRLLAQNSSQEGAVDVPFFLKAAIIHTR